MNTPQRQSKAKGARATGSEPTTAAAASVPVRRRPGADPLGERRFAIFQAWVATQQARAAASKRKREQFSDRTAAIYASLWRGWVEWLAARHAVEWAEATPSLVTEFLSGPAPAPDDRRTRRPIHTERMANYTQQRYWRVLQGVYSHAVATSLIEQSPCVDMPERPAVADESLKRRLLPPGTLAQLRDPARLAQLLPMEDEEDWGVLRDRAAVALVAHCGLSASELRALRGQDLRSGAQVLAAPSRQRSLAGFTLAAGAAPAVDVPSREHPRSLPLPPGALACLLPWLAARARLLAKEAARGRADLGTPLHLQPLLLSREVSDGQERTAIGPPTLHLLFKRCLSAALPATAANKGAYIPHGPSAVRNSVIAEWAATHPSEVAAALAGVQPRALRANPMPPAAEDRTGRGRGAGRARDPGVDRARG